MHIQRLLARVGEVSQGKASVKENLLEKYGR
jgi:hypothetical protein